jgi:DNA-binding NarL/FixJ family response regulator
MPDRGDARPGDERLADPRVTSPLIFLVAMDHPREVEREIWICDDLREDGELRDREERGRNPTFSTVGEQGSKPPHPILGHVECHVDVAFALRRSVHGMHASEPRFRRHPLADGCRVHGGATEIPLPGYVNRSITRPTIRAMGRSRGNGSRSRARTRAGTVRAKTDDGITIVIADDHLAFGEALQVALGKEQDLTVIEVVTDGAGAVEAASRRHPDIVLVDLQMPGMDGVEATRKIREHAPAPSVIMLSGLGDDLTLARAVQAGASGFLPKTEAVHGLADAIRRAYRGEPLHKPAELEESLRRLRRRRIQDASLVSRLERLTPREVEILQDLADGRSPAEIAEHLQMSPHTLRTHTQNVLMKLGVHSKLEAIMAAIRYGKVRMATTAFDD